MGSAHSRDFDERSDRRPPAERGARVRTSYDILGLGASARGRADAGAQLGIAQQPRRARHAPPTRRGARRRSRSRRRRPLRASPRCGRRRRAHRTPRPRGTRSRTPRLRDRPTGRGRASRTRPRAPYSRGRSCVVDAPEEVATRVRVAARGVRAGCGRDPCPAIATCTPSRRRDRVEQHVEALAGHEPADAEHERRVGSSPNRARAARRVRRRRAGGTVRGSTPGGTTSVGSARPATRVGDRRRVLPPATITPAAPRSTRRPSVPVTGQPPVHGDLGTVRDHDVRRGRRAAARRARAAASGRRRRRRRRPRGRARRRADAWPRSGAGSPRIVRSMRNGCCSVPRGVAVVVTRGEHGRLGGAAGGATARRGTTGCHRPSAGSRSSRAARSRAGVLGCERACFAERAARALRTAPHAQREDADRGGHRAERRTRPGSSSHAATPPTINEPRPCERSKKLLNVPTTDAALGCRVRRRARAAATLDRAAMHRPRTCTVPTQEPRRRPPRRHDRHADRREP